MLPATVLTVTMLLGVVQADVCQPHSRLPPLLVTEAQPRPTVYAWPEQEVELHCRPSQTGGCRWMKNSRLLGTDCTLSTTERGTITCLRGEETCGSIVLNNPPGQRVQKRYYSGYYNRYWEYHGQRNWSHKSSTFLCPKSGTIIREDKLCDGTEDCDSGEDEWSCDPACGRPFLEEHSELSSDPLDAYPDSSQVTYICQSGFSFAETLSRWKRTCQAGRWTSSPPVCLRNMALNRTVAVTGHPMGDCGSAVDGDLDTWCMLAPGVLQQTLTVRLEDIVTITKVLVRALNSRYTVTLRDVNQLGDEVDCPCQESSGDQIYPAVSGIRICSCPEGQTGGKQELLIRGESGTFMSLSVAEIAALEAPDASTDECTHLGRPAHGRFEHAGPGVVKLSCDPGHSRSCSETVQCSAIKSGNVRLSCIPVSCQQPPAIPNTKITQNNGTEWRAVAEYSCAAGYMLYPSDQNTTARCGDDGLWSIGHVSCLPETDIRVVAMRLSEQHARSMAELRAELLSGQQRLLVQQNRTQHRLSALERDVALLGLAEGAYLNTAQAAAALTKQQEDATRSVPEEPGQGGAPGGPHQMEADAGLAGQEGVAESLQQLEAATGLVQALQVAAQPAEVAAQPTEAGAEAGAEEGAETGAEAGAEEDAEEAAGAAVGVGGGW